MPYLVSGTLFPHPCVAYFSFIRLDVFLGKTADSMERIGSANYPSSEHPI